MGDTLEEQKTGGSKARPGMVALWAVAVLVAAAALYVIGHRFIKPAAPTPAPAASAASSGDMAALTKAYAGTPEPPTSIIDADGKSLTLAAFKGRPILVNLWATWCAPCRKEMPSLAKLKAAYGDKLTIIPVSMDKAPDREKARAFIGANAPLPFYQDEALAMPYDIKPPVEGFPTTVLFDAQGREVARVAMDHDWNSPAAHQSVDALLKGS